MRQIKFRYWNSISNMMVNNPEMPYKEGWTIEQLFEDRGWVWMQYTGLKDKNGKDIYEGDVDKKGRVVRWNYLYLCWGWFKKDGFVEQLESDWCDDKGKTLDMWTDFATEIIGNIHEDKHLLNTK